MIRSAKTYVVTTGAVFALLTIAQVVHAVREPEHFREPAFLFHLVGTLALTLWSTWLLTRKPSGRAV